MSGPFLTVDAGNSRWKLRAWRAVGPGARPELVAAADLDAGADGLAGARAWLAPLGRCAAAALAAVGEARLARDLERALAPHVDGPVAVAPRPGLEVRCAEPERVGLDRLYAARGALALAARPAVVVDAGTALTVDAVRPLDEPPAGGGTTHLAGLFLGGAIAPGPRLLARALAAGTARLPEVEPEPGAPALGRDTRAAIRSGVAVGLRGAARELARRVGEEAGLAGAPVVLTGGARAFLLAPEPFTDAELVVEPELVHLGLFAALRAALAR